MLWVVDVPRGCDLGSASQLGVGAFTHSVMLLAVPAATAMSAARCLACSQAGGAVSAGVGGSCCVSWSRLASCSALGAQMRS